MLKRSPEINISKEAYQEAVAAALEAARRSYSPYTRCPSAVALITPGGIHSGGIIENAAHNPSLQPLQAALIQARMHGITQYSQVSTDKLNCIWIRLSYQPCSAVQRTA